MEFQIGNRIIYTPEILELCDPVIADDEIRGVVVGGIPASAVEPARLLVRFDSGDREWTPARWFQLED